MRRLAVALALAALVATSAAADYRGPGPREPSGYLALGLFNPTEGHYDRGWEIAGIGIPDSDRSGGMRVGLGLQFFDTSAYELPTGPVAAGDQQQFWIDAGYVLQFGGEYRKQAYAGAGLTWITASWQGAGANLDDDAIGFHLVAGSRVSNRFLLEAEWVTAEFGRVFEHEQAGGLTIRGAWGF